MLPEEDIRRRRIMEALRAGLKIPPSGSETIRGTPGFAGGTLQGQIDRSQQSQPSQPFPLPTQGPARTGTMEVRTGEPEGIVPPPTLPRGLPPGSVPALGLPAGRTDIPNITIPPPPDSTEAPTMERPPIGFSTKGLTGVDRLIQRRKALEQASPMSSVESSEDFEEVQPPKLRKGIGGRFRSMGDAALAGFGSGDPDRPLVSLGRGIGAAITGAVSPKSGAQISRKVETNMLDADIARRIKIEQEQAELDKMRGPGAGQMSTRIVGQGEYPGIEPGTEIRVRVDPRTGQVTDVMGPNNKPVVSDVARKQTGAPHYEKDSEGYLISVQGGRATRVLDDSGKPVRVKATNADGEVVEVEVNGKTLRVPHGKALDYYGQIGERETKRAEERSEREAKYNAAKSEYDSLVSAEEEARRQKDQAYKALEEMRKSTPNDEMGRQDLSQATKAAQDADAFYRSFGEKKKEAARRMQENQVAPVSTGKPKAGRVITRANLERYAKDKRISVEAAERFWRDEQGARIQ